MSGTRWSYGGDGDDIIDAGIGVDFVYAGAGNDQLRGDAGSDLMYGGDGADRFIFSSLADAPMTGLDRVMDFVRGTDKIDLTAIDADSTLTGNQAFHLNAARPFFASAGDLNISSALLGTLVEGDVNGDGFSDFRFLVVSNHAMQASDFML